MATWETDEYYYIDDMAFNKLTLRMSSIASDQPADSLIDAFWPGGIIFYDIDAGFSPQYEKLIIEVISLIQEQVTTAHLEFRPVRNKVGKICRRSYLFIEKSVQKKCESEIGMQQHRERTMVWLNQEACTKGIILHELLHALGRYHEQCRPDRDNFVEIKYGEIVKTACQNFAKLITPFKLPDPTLSAPYDINSIMHYDSCAFSCSGQYTMVHRSGNRHFIALNRKHMTELDIKKMRLMYPQDAKVPYRDDFCQAMNDQARRGGQNNSASIYKCSFPGVIIMSIILLLVVLSLP